MKKPKTTRIVALAVVAFSLPVQAVDTLFELDAEFTPRPSERPAPAAPATLIVPSSIEEVSSRAPTPRALHTNDPRYVGSQPADLHLSATSAMVFDQASGRILFAKNPELETPIASITKLMTAVVVLDAKLPMDERITITQAEVDTHKHTGSRLTVGQKYSRETLLQLALVASENRAAAALARSYPGGTERFVAAMNAKARALGMHNTHYEDSTGLRAANHSTADDLVKLVNAAYQRYPEIRRISTTDELSLGGGTRKVRKVVKVNGKRVTRTRTVNTSLDFRNTNRLVREDEWDIGLSKTGYIREAGHCLVMQATIASRPVVIVLLDAMGRDGRMGDAQRIREWLERDQSGQAARGTPLPHPAKGTKTTRASSAKSTVSSSSRVKPVAMRR